MQINPHDTCLEIQRGRGTRQTHSARGEEDSMAGGGLPTKYGGWVLMHLGPQEETHGHGLDHGPRALHRHATSRAQASSCL